MLLLCGCSGSGKSKLEDGQSVDSGNRRFDSYFAEVAEVRDEVDKLDSDMFAVRGPLVDALDLDTDVSMPELIQAVRKQTEEYKGYGILLTLRLTPSPPEVSYEKGSQDGGDKADVFRKAVEESSYKAMGLYEKYSQQIAFIDSLDKRRGELADSIERTSGNVDKGLLEDEIVGAGRVLDKSSQKLQKDARTLSYYMLALAGAVDSGAYAQRAQKCTEAIAAADDPKPKRPAFRGGPRPGAGARPAGSPRPPPPKPGGDFEM